MLGKLSDAQRNYVLYHINLEFHIPDRIQQLFCFQSSCHGNEKNSIIFLESDRTFNVKAITQFEDIPVLFPVLSESTIYELDARGNLIFSHDLFKSAFYLLSGYQEYSQSHSKDNLGRFSYADSVQCKLDCIHKPVVNYYFQWIISGLQQYCQRHNLTTSISPRSTNFKFLLSHDVDSVDLYSFEYWGYKIKEVVGLKPSSLSKLTNLRLGVDGLLRWAGLKKKTNPHWNFDYLRALERQYNLKSTFYFLDQGVKHSDAYYSFGEKRILDLFDFIKKEGCEIGLHGASRSCDSLEVMSSNLDRLKQFSQASITGNRQHRLLWNHPRTAKIIQQLDFQYDTTLGFAAHEGFRNGFCYPFKLYDFESDRMLDVWEFPLVVMDVTLFAYQKYSPETAYQKCVELITEVKKFKGLFTLLWHNSFFDEVTYPGVTKFYADLLQIVASHKPDNMLANELAESLNSK